jgi:ubiquinone/menaquinone biosynthesis C-methylase UbiE
MRKVLDVAGGNGNTGRKLYPNCNITIIDKKTGWDLMEKGILDGDWDVILMSHIIEHVTDPDFLLEECHRVAIKNGSFVEIGAPNLAAWFNRICLLFGYVPFGVELSKYIHVGQLPIGKRDELGGHRYMYTLPALCQLVEYHGFKITKVIGQYSEYKFKNPIIHFIFHTIDRVLVTINPRFSSAFRIQCNA